jgi:hypothetical protein
MRRFALWLVVLMILAVALPIRVVAQAKDDTAASKPDAAKPEQFKPE